MTSGSSVSWCGVLVVMLCGLVWAGSASAAADVDGVKPPQTYLLRYRGPAGRRLQYVCARGPGPGYVAEVFLTEVLWQGEEGGVLPYTQNWITLTDSYGDGVWSGPDDAPPTRTYRGRIAATGRKLAAPDDGDAEALESYRGRGSVLPVFPDEEIAVGQEWTVDRRIKGEDKNEYRLPIAYKLLRVDPGPGRMGAEGKYVAHQLARMEYAGAAHNQYMREYDPEGRMVGPDLSVAGSVLFDMDAGVILWRRETWQERVYISNYGDKLLKPRSRHLEREQWASRLMLSPTGSAVEAFFYPDGMPEPAKPKPGKRKGRPKGGKGASVTNCWRRPREAVPG